MTGRMSVHGELEVRGERRGVIIITYRAALVLVLGVVLALVVGFTKISSVQHDYVRKIAASQCNAGNDARANDLAAWQRVDRLIRNPNDPRAVSFMAFIAKKDAQRVFNGTICAVPVRSTPHTTATTTTLSSKSAG